ncbi:MAG: nucleotide exchange factor GrpE [Longimicrobiales bacterium]|nr:nucleotide exchange factor GrpE [Longimicrobiales bacterium]
MTDQQNDTTPEEAVDTAPDGGDREVGEEIAVDPGSPDRGSAEGSRPDGDEVEQLREQLESLNDRHLRLAAEFDNYRKRNQRDRESLASRLQADLVTALLDVLDDLQRVGEGGDDANAEAVLEGVRLVEKKFQTVLEGAGVEPVDAEGARFDPELMEALGMVPTDVPEQDGRVADVFQRGYRLRDMLLRPARVRVYQYSEDG